MNSPRSRTGAQPTGIRLVLVALMLILLGMFMQAYSLIYWDHAVDLGLQNDRFNADPVENARARESWGVAVADMVWLLPLTLFAIWGVARRRLSGFAAGFMVFAIAVYFPLVFAFQRWQSHPGTVAIACALWVLPSLAAIAGLWIHRGHFEDR